MTAAQPITPVIPSPGRVAGTPRVAPPAVRPLPMAGPAAALSVPAGVVYGTGRIDASGRVADHVVSCALGWREGDRLTLTASPGVVTALYRFRTHRGCCGLRFGRMNWLRQDRGLCPFACST